MRDASDRVNGVDGVITVVVDSVAGFGRVGIDAGRAVVAITALAGVVRRKRRAQASRVLGHSVAVLILVPVEVRAPRRVFGIDRAVAIVVDTVAGLLGPRVYVLIAVVAVRA